MLLVRHEEHYLTCAKLHRHNCQIIIYGGTGLICWNYVKTRQLNKTNDTEPTEIKLLVHATCRWNSLYEIKKDKVLPKALWLIGQH